MKSKLTLLLILIISINNLFAQDTLRVLFLGNSYTAYNNLPQLVQSLSSSAGKTLIIDYNMPGGMNVSGHVNDATSIAKINQGNWDYVVIQEQSQIPTINHFRYNNMYPAITDLKTLVEKVNPCTRMITYMTWGRRFGGQHCDPRNTHCSPVFVDFNHMQDSLTIAYTEISDKLNIQCAPVGVTWQNILNDTTLILHSNDNSHPNIDGSYVAALSIYSSIWKQPSIGITFNAGLTQSRALYYQQMSDSTIFNSQNDWNLNINDPIANFNYSTNGNSVTFTNSSTSNMNRPLNYFWDFGDGNTSVLENPNHSFSSSGIYSVKLIVKDCIFSDTASYTVQIGATGIHEDGIYQIRIYPNPTNSNLNFDYGDAINGYHLMIKNTYGQQVFHKRITSKTDDLNSSNWGGSGLYFAHIIDSQGNTIEIRKIILQ
jgi:PKD repeat protein